MKFSVVTISFNQAQYLRACIESVLKQSHEDLEYIIVDPGSTDGSRDIINEFTDSRIIRIFQPDAGPADGLNSGLGRCSAPLFSYLNSDDILLPDSLSIAVRRFENRSNIDVVYGHGYMIDSAGSVKRRLYSDHFDIKGVAFGASITIQPSTFFRRAAVVAVGGFNPSNKSNWDGELLIDLALAGHRFERIDEFLSCYRVHAEGITGSAKLLDAHRRYGARMFEKIQGRQRRPFDVVPQLLYRMKKHISNPKATVERLRFGAVFGSKR